MKFNLNYGLIGAGVGVLLSILVFGFKVFGNLATTLAWSVLFLVEKISMCSGEGCLILIYVLPFALKFRTWDTA